MGRKHLTAGTLALSMGIAATSMLGIGSAGAAYTMNVTELVNASTSLAKLHQTVAIPTGKFTGTINVTKGTIKGRLKLPPATTTVAIAGLGLATATVSLAPTKPVTGKIGLRTLLLKAKSTFYIRVQSLTPTGTSVNLVGNRCETSTPVSLSFSGTLNAIGPTSVKGTYTIPSLSNCGLATLALDAALSGPGNTFTATMTPV
jgi:hypothetical protein